jgi:hypothetical protein
LTIPTVEDFSQEIFPPDPGEKPLLDRCQIRAPFPALVEGVAKTLKTDLKNEN